MVSRALVRAFDAGGYRPARASNSSKQTPALVSGEAEQTVAQATGRGCRSDCPVPALQTLAFHHRFHATAARPVNPHDVEMNDAVTPAL